MITFAMVMMVLLIILGTLLGWWGVESMLDGETKFGSVLLFVGAFVIGLAVLIMLRLLGGVAL